MTCVTRLLISISWFLVHNAARKCTAPQHTDTTSFPGGLVSLDLRGGNADTHFSPFSERWNAEPSSSAQTWCRIVINKYINFDAEKRPLFFFLITRITSKSKRRKETLGLRLEIHTYDVHNISCMKGVRIQSFSRQKGKKPWGRGRNSTSFPGYFVSSWFAIIKTSPHKSRRNKTPWK